MITADLQGNGRTADIPDRPISIEQYAEDVVGLLKYLGISKADFVGESYGGNAAAVIAIRDPELVRRVVTYAATFAPPPATLNSETTHYDRPPTLRRETFNFRERATRKSHPIQITGPRFTRRLARFSGKAFRRKNWLPLMPFLIVQGDHDFVRIEHFVETVKLIPYAELAVIPDASHFALTSEQGRVIPLVKHFLEKPEKRIPIATANVGYHPGETR